MIEALFYNRFEWIGDTKGIGDIERLLTWTGVSVPVVVDGRPTIRPVYTQIDYLTPDKTVALAPMGLSKAQEFELQELFQVAPARSLHMQLSGTYGELVKTLNQNIISSRTTKYIKTADASRPSIMEISTGQCNAIPVLEVGSALSSDDIVTVGDGDIKAQNIREAWNTALTMAAQALGVHSVDTIKKERLVADEAEATSDITEIIRLHEISVRQRVAEWLGLKLKVLI
mgnify:CR=1 FL=1